LFKPTEENLTTTALFGTDKAHHEGFHCISAQALAEGDGNLGAFYD
jgi:hypothetical protein